MSLTKISALQRADDEYLLLEQRRSVASTPAGLKRQNYKKIDRPTEETIAQYNQAHQKEPVIMQEVDIDGDKLFNSDGTPVMKKYLYHPVEAQPVLIDPMEGVENFKTTIPIEKSPGKYKFDETTRAFATLTDRQAEYIGIIANIRGEIDALPSTKNIKSIIEHTKSEIDALILEINTTPGDQSKVAMLETKNAEMATLKQQQKQRNALKKELADRKEDNDAIKQEIAAKQHEITSAKKQYAGMDYRTLDIDVLFGEYERLEELIKTNRQELLDIGVIIDNSENDDLAAALLEKENLEKEKLKLENELRFANDTYIAIDERKKEYNTQQLVNKATIESNREKNKIALKIYQDQLNALNSGAFKMTQEPYESDAEYKQRLISHSQIEAPAAALYDAKVYATKEIRSKLKSIIDNPTVVDLIANSLSDDEKYDVMSHFGAYSKKYKEIFGTYNPSQSITELVSFFRNPITETSFERMKDTGKLGVKIKESVVKAEPLLLNPYEESKFVITIVNNDGSAIGGADAGVEVGNILKIAYPNHSDFYIKIVTTHKKTLSTDTTYKILYSLYATENSFMLLSSKQIKYMLERDLGYTAEMIYELKSIIFTFSAWNSTTTNAEILINRFNLNGNDMIKTVTLINKALGAEETTETGWGIGVKEVPSSAKFGNISINVKKLYYDDILSIRDKNGYAVPSVTSVKVSTKLRNIILESLENRHIDCEKIEKLTSADKSMYKHLIVLAKLHKTVDCDLNEPISKLKNELTILEGEFNAGNDNPKLIKDIKSILHKLHQFGVITKNQVLDYFRNLKD